MYKNYIFDLYGTLVDIRTNEARKSLWDKLALIYCYYGASYTYRELKKAYLQEVAKELRSNNKTQYPDINILLVFERLFAAKGVKVDKDMTIYMARLFRVLSTDYIRLYPGVIDMLESLKTHDKRIFMLSNGQREFTVPELKHLGIYDYFDGLYSSSDIEICKPDPAFFNYVIDKEKVDKNKSIFIGNDDKCDIEGAKGAGLDCIYIHSNLSGSVEEVGSTYSIWNGDIRKVINLTDLDISDKSAAE